MKKFMRRWHNKNSPDCAHDDSPDDQGEEGGNYGEDYLKCVGESVASMLDPMGMLFIYLYYRKSPNIHSQALRVIHYMTKSFLAEK